VQQRPVIGAEVGHIGKLGLDNALDLNKLYGEVASTCAQSSS
jgi:hypothetical protein